jgi:hypothetical protein
MKNKWVHQLLSLVVSLLLVVGCTKGDDKAILPADPAQMVGNWVLVSPNTGYTITLTIEPVITNTMIAPPKFYKISGQGPVNQYSSSLDYAPSGALPDERRIRIDPVFTVTKIAETAEQSQISATYLRNLGQAYQYALTSNGELRLTYDGLYYELSTPPALIYKRQ